MSANPASTTSTTPPHHLHHLHIQLLPTPPPPPGATWTQLLSNTGAYYFNGIDCFDETHCVFVGEGYADGASPGARVYV